MPLVMPLVSIVAVCCCNCSLLPLAGPLIYIIVAVSCACALLAGQDWSFSQEYCSLGNFTYLYKFILFLDHLRQNVPKTGG